MTARLWRSAALAAVGLSALACAGELEQREAEDQTTAMPTTELPAPAPPAVPLPAPTTTTAPSTTTTAPVGETVSRVIDGDTIEMANGTRVRLIGIDTPERGDCGYDQASGALSDLIAGQPVTLTSGAADEYDRYGRLLRYVGTYDGLDAGQELIDRGAAIARYDSRDGYGAHPRQDAYVTADAATPALCEAAG